MYYECKHAYKKLSHSYQTWTSYTSDGTAPDGAPIIDVFVCMMCGDTTEHFRQPNKGNSVDAKNPSEKEIIEAGIRFIGDTNFGGE